MKKTQPKTETPPAAAAVSVPQPAPEVPDWANNTPYETLYTIEMWQQEIVETVDMSRAEYVALKQHLAAMRGIAPAGPGAPDVLRQAELQSVFDDLEIINLKILGYRRRILAGATIEDGPLTTEWEDQEPGDESPRDESWFKFSAYGLEICSAEYSQALKARAVAEPGTAPQPKLDPMKIPRGPLSPEQEQEAGAALLSRLQGQMANMSTCELQSLAWYVDIEDADCGCDTPAEDFITTLVLHHTVRPLTPDDATRKLEEFRENFDGMVRAARAFTARYPEAVNPAA
jgi:hypothetical protein